MFVVNRPESRSQSRVISICATSRGHGDIIGHAIGDSADRKSAPGRTRRSIVSPINDIRLDRKDGDDVWFPFSCSCTLLRLFPLSTNSPG